MMSEDPTIKARPLSALTVPAGVLNVVELLIVALALWCLVPPLLLGRELEVALPFGQHLTSSLTSNNLLLLWVLLFIRAITCSRPGASTWLAALFGKCSPGMVGVVIGAVFFLVYFNVALPRTWPCGDTVPTKLIPISLIEEGNVDLNEFWAGVPHERRYGFHGIGGRYHSAYPVGTSLTVLPIYKLVSMCAPESFATWRLIYAQRGGDDLMPNIANLLEQLSAALIAALCMVAYWHVARMAGRSEGLAIWLTVAVGLGTSLLSTGATSLWQHGPACLLLCLMVLTLMHAEKGGRWMLLLAGLIAGWAYACRPTTGLVSALAGLWVLYRFKWKVWQFILPASVIGLAVLAYQYAIFGAVAGGYSRSLDIFSGFDWRAMLTILFSPSRGLFLFSPFLLFALPGCRRAFRRPFGVDALCVFGALATLLLFSFWGTWSAGSSFGSRYLCEAAFLLGLVLALRPTVLESSRVAFVVFALTAFFSCHLHVTGGLHGDAGWTQRMFKGDNIRAAWRWNESQLVWTLARPGQED